MHALFFRNLICNGFLAAGAITSAYAANCGNLTRLEVRTPAELCVGIVISGLHMPRGILPLADGRLLVVEMGSWVAGRGSLLLLTANKSGTWSPRKLLEGLDRPHGIALGPDGKIWIGEAGQIVRIPLAAVDKPVDVAEIAIAGLPAEGRHPSKSFVFGPRGDLYLNIGSATDNCEASARSPASTSTNAKCPEANTRGLVRHYLVDAKGRVIGGEVFASGLRNSVALAIHASGTVLQAENSRDAINKPLKLANDNDLPHDELNVLKAGQNYGWPYCYDKKVASPEFPQASCKDGNGPTALLPAHAAPLGMAWWRDSLVIGYHGYRANGHRLVAFPVNKQGLPNGPSTTLIDDWKDARGTGSPVDVRVTQDGRIFLSDDKHGQILVLQNIKG